jgi:diacylglycerol kinase
MVNFILSHIFYQAKGTRNALNAIECRLKDADEVKSKVFLILTEVFLCFFLRCKANTRVKLAKTGHGPHSSTLVVICFVPFIVCL